MVEGKYVIKDQKTYYVDVTNHVIIDMTRLFGDNIPDIETVNGWINGEMGGE